MKLSSTNLSEAPKMYETENDILLNRGMELNALMNQRLASAVDLQLQKKQAHWNVKGPNYIGLHELFDKVAEAVGEYGDMIAERIVQLGGIAEGTVRIAASGTRLPESSPEIADGMAQIEGIARAFPFLDKKHAARSMKRTNRMMPIRRTCSLRFRVA